MYAVRRHPQAFTLDPSSKKTRRLEDPRHLAFIRRLPSVISRPAISGRAVRCIERSGPALAGSLTTAGSFR
jgi:hypothetical protein